MLIQKILETVYESSLTASDIFLSGYAESYRKLNGISSNKLKDIDWEKIEKKRFYSLLSKLHRDGFIKKINNKKSRKDFWQITKSGIKKLNLLQGQENIKKDRIKMPRIVKIEENDFLKVIIFDIPEDRRKQRAWLRRVLVNLGFKKLQLSVWIGKTKLPDEFFYHLRHMKLINFIHVFAISKVGSLSDAA